MTKRDEGKKDKERKANEIRRVGFDFTTSNRVVAWPLKLKSKESL